MELDGRLDKRLVRTFLLTLQAIVTFRHSSGGLLLSELGGYITGPEQAPAGTKRLSKLLRSKRGYRIIERFLWRRADQRVTELLREDETALVVWDESVWEKPESLHSDGLSPVRSSKAQRLKRVKSGFHNPPGGRPICVPGLNWISLLVLGMKGTPSLTTMRFAFFSVPLKLMFALVVAMLLYNARKLVGVYRAVYYTPSIVGGSIAVAVMWRQIFGSRGLVNALLASFDIPGRPWLGDPQTAIWTLILMAVWQFGSPMLIFLAGLK